MKSRLISISFLLVVFIVGCSSTNRASQSSLPIRGESADKPIIWKQEYYRNITLEDSVLFYNSEKITLEGSFFRQSFFVENGVVNVIDSISHVSKIVPARTAGGLMDFKKNSSGEIMIMYISFSRDETTYKFSFSREDGGSFVLNSKAVLIFNDKKYDIVAITTNPCRLLFYINKIEQEGETKESAEGWVPGY